MNTGLHPRQKMLYSIYNFNPSREMIIIKQITMSSLHETEE